MLLLVFFAFPMIVLAILCTLDTKSTAFFSQKRIGQYGKPFTLYKFKTISPFTGKKSIFGKFLRSYKIDELPQLYNIIKGEMSFVGPRPDIPGYYDKLVFDDRRVLEIKPGLTSEASIKYIEEEKILSESMNPDFYNDKIIFPDKVKMNLDYLKKMSLKEDARIVFLTIVNILKK